MYVFPFDRIPTQSIVVIYGAGFVGQSFLIQILQIRYCKIVCVVDRRYKVLYSSYVQVFSPDRICTVKYDFVVIALKPGAEAEKIKKYLHETLQVPASKIVCAVCPILLEKPIHLFPKRHLVQKPRCKMKKNDYIKY